MKLKAIGGHCYLGGFLLGLEKAGFSVLTSWETKKRGMRAAQIIGLPSCEFGESFNILPRADLVVGNPPCSRFSHLSLSFFDKEAYTNLETFPEILDLAQMAKKAKARVLWWETGPLAWSVGKELIIRYHRFLNKFLGPTTTLMIRVDLRYIGIPQKRPRNHIIHVRQKLKPPAAISGSWPIKGNLGQWLKTKTKNFSLELAVCPKKEIIADPVSWARIQDQKVTFRSMVPKIVSKLDFFSQSVVSRRLMVWLEENRFFDLLEYGALMTYPLDKIKKLANSLNSWEDGQVLLSQSVAPEITSWIDQNIIQYWLNNKESPAGVVCPQKTHPGFWQLDLAIPNRLERALKRGQKPLLNSF